MIHEIITLYHRGNTSSRATSTLVFARNCCKHTILYTFTFPVQKHRVRNNVIATASLRAIILIRVCINTLTLHDTASNSAAPIFISSPLAFKTAVR